MPQKKKRNRNSENKKTANKKLLRDYRLDKNKKKQSNYLRKSLLVGIIFLVLVFLGIVAILFVEAGIAENPFVGLFAKQQMFAIEDQCSLIVGQLIHTIDNEDTCEMRCKTECSVRELNFHDSEFTEIVNNCNSCDCYCR